MGLSKTSLQRHKENCVPRDVIQARLFGKIADADMLLGQVSQLQKRSETILSSAEQSSDHRMALAAIRELGKLIELQSRLVSPRQSSEQPNVLLTPEYRQLRTIILEHLGPYPQARLQLAAALSGQDDAGT
jgi:hypothetical protein